MLNFVLIGASGYVAPRHMKAIKDVGGNLLAAYDPKDSVGILDSHFPNCHFFTDLERLELYLDLVGNGGVKVDYVCICSPNHLHLSHIAWGLRQGANVICEKPLVLHPHDLAVIRSLQKSHNKKVFTILQLRLHPVIVALKDRIGEGEHNVVLNYHTPRGNWYGESWKGDVSKSGGLLMNIGIHLFDILLWLFGDCEKCTATISGNSATGILSLKHASVYWELSTLGSKSSRTMFVDGEEINFTDGFTELHTESYRKILNGEGFTVSDVQKSIELVSKLRNATN